jgi:hypothetical protein
MNGVKQFHQVEGSEMFQSLSSWLWGKEEFEAVSFEERKYVRNEIEQFMVKEPEQMLPYPQL